MASNGTIQIVLAYIEYDGQVLLSQRRLTAPQGGCWEFPGGKVEQGETFSEALQRELLEEIGVKASVGDEIAGTRYAYPEVIVELHLFRCSIEHGVPEARDVADLRWAPKADLANYRMPPANAELLAALQ